MDIRTHRNQECWQNCGHTLRIVSNLAACRGFCKGDLPEPAGCVWDPHFIKRAGRVD